MKIEALLKLDPQLSLTLKTNDEKPNDVVLEVAVAQEGGKAKARELATLTNAYANFNWKAIPGKQEKGSVSELPHKCMPRFGQAGTAQDCRTCLGSTPCSRARSPQDLYLGEVAGQLYYPHMQSKQCAADCRPLWLAAAEDQVQVRRQHD